MNTRKRVELLLVESTTRPGSLDMRTPEGGLFGHIRDELVKAGFQSGDRVVIVPLVHGDRNGRALCGADAPAGDAADLLTCPDCRVLQGVTPRSASDRESAHEGATP